MTRIYWQMESQLPLRYLRKIVLLIVVVTVVAFIGFGTQPIRYWRWPSYINEPEVVFEVLTSSQYRVWFDPSRRYAIAEFAIIGKNWKTARRNPSPYLATQGSLLYLHHLLLLGQRWQGMMSVAVLVPDVDFHWAVLLIENMRRCHPQLMANVSIHLVYPVDYPPVISSDDTPWDVDNCGEANLDLTNRTLFNASNILYPQNLLRNVASRTCPTENVLVIDIDMIPSLGLAQQLEGFLSTNGSNCSKCVFVIPAFEVDKNATVPNNKTELLGLVKLELARPYREKAFKDNQWATNATRWKNLSDEGPLAMAYGLTCFKFFYEPFYLAGGPVPPFDTRFLGYGFTRNTQAYETQLAGFRFFVLNNAFLVQHEMVNGPYASPGRKEQVEANKLLYKKLKREFAVKYEELNKLPCAFSH